MSYNWEYLAHRYIVDGLSFKALAALPGAPVAGTLRNRCTLDKWNAQRAARREQVTTKTREITLNTEAEVAARHVRIAQALQAKALQALQKLDVATLPASEVRQFLATATDIERKALGMDNKMSVKAEVRYVDEDPERARLARAAADALTREWENPTQLN